MKCSLPSFDGRNIPVLLTVCLVIFAVIPLRGAEYVLDKLLANGQIVKAQPDGGFILPPATKQIALQILWTGEASIAPRLRTSLELGNESREAEVLNAFFIGPIVLDAVGDEVLNLVKPLKGDSQGWLDGVQSSGFERKNLSFDLPSESRSMRFILSSNSEQLSTMGWLAIRNCVIELTTRNDKVSPVRLRLDSPPGSGHHHWVKQGSQHTMAERVLDSTGEHMVVLRDDSPLRWAGWGSIQINVKEFRRVNISWEQCHSVGYGGSRTIHMHSLIRGQNLLRLQQQNLEGQPIGDSVQIPLTLLAPIYERTTYQAAASFLVLLVFFLLTRHFSRRQLQQKLAVLQRENALNQERARIARDLHDNLGANLTQLALLSDLIQRGVANGLATQDQLDQMFELAQHLTHQVDEAIWVVNPEKDILESLLTYVTDHVQTYLAATGIRCRLQLPCHIPDVTLTSATRHHLLMVVKEALHNVVKHAGAEEFRMKVCVDEGVLMIHLEDDGRGFPEDLQKGNGLDNMHQRMLLIGGTLDISAGQNGGTRVLIHLPLTLALESRA